MLSDVLKISCKSLASIIGLDVILFSFLLLTSTSVFQLGFSSGWTFKEYSHNIKPWSFAEILEMPVLIVEDEIKIRL